MKSAGTSFDSMEVAASDLVEFFGVLGSEVGELGVLEMIPQLFNRIELGSVRRQRFQLQTGEPPQQLADRFTTMHVASIPQHRHPSSQVAEQRPQELCRADIVDVLLGKRAKPQREPLPAWRQTESGRQRDFVTMPGPLPQNRSLPSRREAATDQRGQQQSTFINQYQMRTLGNGAF